MAAKHWQRLKLIGFNTVYSLSGQLSGIVLSLTVIRVFSDRLWGEYSSFSIWLLLPLHFAYFGNKDYLMRAYSMAPAQIREAWSRSFLSRLLILLPVLLITFILARHNSLAVDMIVFSFLRFCCQSFDSLIVYFRRFSRSVYMELGALVFALLVCIVFKSTGRVFGIDELIGTLVLAEAGKAIGYLFTFKNYITLSTRLSPLKSYLKDTLPFFLIGLSGMLASKADLIFSNFYFDKQTLARYQVLTNFLILLQTGSVFVLQPFIRNLYRLKKEAIQKLSTQLTLLGILASVLGTAGLYLILQYGYKLHFSLPIYAAGSLFVLPIYAYTPYIYYLYREKKQMLMVLINFAGIALTLLTAVILFRIFSPQPLYLLLGICAQQFFIWIVVKTVFRRIQLA
jgi:O-antigen/teichoic acid export membrane protein